MKTHSLIRIFFATAIAAAASAAKPERHDAADRAQVAAKSFARAVGKHGPSSLRIYHINDDGTNEPIVSEVGSYPLPGLDTPLKVNTKSGKSHVILDLKLEKGKGDVLVLSGKLDIAIIYEGRVVSGMPVPVGMGSVMATEFRSQRVPRGEPLYLGSSTHLNSPGQPKFEDTSSLFLIWD